jgi:hypothetical protein
MRGSLAVFALALALAACGQADKHQSEPALMVAEEAMAPPAPPPPPPPPMERQMAQGGVADAIATADGRSAPNQPSSPAPILYLAYSYAMGLELPAQNLTGLVDRHVQTCQAAGPRLCQLIGTNVSGDPESSLTGYVSLRAEPGWLRTFMTGISAQTDAAGGRILQNATNTEDLTRAIVDTEARLRAQTTLRDRLQRLLESRPGRLADLLEVERELARVQAEIDSVQSNLAVMRTRVAMSELTLNYQSAPKPLRGDTFRPLGEAFAGFLGIVVTGFAAIITIFAGLLPFAIVLVPMIWGLLRWRRARGGRFFGQAKPKADAPKS